MSADRLLRQSSLENLIESDSGGDQEMFNPVSVETSGDAEDLRHEIDEHVQRKKSLSEVPFVYIVQRRRQRRCKQNL